MTAGGVAPAIYNAANELAVAAFLEGRIPFLAIPRVVEHTLQSIRNFEPADLPAVVAADAESRHVTASHLKSFSS
jgi:1-deoxy-D-xylulose-5-phosphate reductoisomerase